MQRIKLSTNLNLDEYIPKELYLKFESTPHILMRAIGQTADHSGSEAP